MDINRLIFAMTCYLLANCFKAREILLTKEEDLAFEKQLRIINKPGVAVITTEHGDIYDCVDFYKQPAFDHPSLKNHTFHPQMSYKYQEKKSNSSSINEHNFIPFKDGGCPTGSVPIRRITKADLMREKEHPWRLESLNGNELDLAIVQTQPGYGPFAGSGMTAGLYKPPVKSGSASYSSVRMRIQNGNDIIQVGWRIDPLLYGDNQLRFYIYFKAGTKECFNTRCAGFISTNSEYPLDYVFKNHYTPGHFSMPEIKIYLIRDILGNWWIEVGNHTQLGFWPPHIFNGLNGLATYIDWGGEVLNTPQAQDIEMGLGHFPDCIALQTAYIRAIRVITPERKILNAAITQSYMTDKNKYKVLNIDRHAIFYGGPYKRT